MLRERYLFDIIAKIINDRGAVFISIVGSFEKRSGAGRPARREREYCRRGRLAPERIFLGHVRICRVLSPNGGALSWLVFLREIMQPGSTPYLGQLPGYYFTYNPARVEPAG